MSTRATTLAFLVVAEALTVVGAATAALTCGSPTGAPPGGGSGSGSGSGSTTTGDAGTSAPVDAVTADAVSLDAASGHGPGSFAVGVVTAASNCGRDGADLTTIRTSLLGGPGASTCEAVVFQLVASTGVPLPTVNRARSLCSPVTAAELPCFESGVSISAGDLPPGTYHLVVDGVSGDRVCWHGELSIGVVSDTRADQAIVLTRLPGC